MTEQNAQGMTAVPLHRVESRLSITMSWEDAQAILITIQQAEKTDHWLPAPSHQGALQTFERLLAKHVYVTRSVVTSPVGGVTDD